MQQSLNADNYFERVSLSLLLVGYSISYLYLFAKIYNIIELFT